MKIKIPKEISNTTKYIVIGLLLAGVLFYGIRSSRLYDRYSELKGQNEILSADIESLAKKAHQIITEKGKYIDAMDKRIKELNVQLDLDYQQMDNKNKDLIRLERELRGLKDKDKIIVNLSTQVNTWKEKFTLAEKIIGEKDGIIFSLSEKYEAQTVVSVEFETLYMKEAELRKLLETRIRLADRKIRRSKTLNTAQTIGLGVIGGFLIYSLVKK